ncbi:DUF192 domain-containing protein [Novosphingobium flavum]|uniref:DUF192 domain-containing protein n=2 Tax=Novosphingobium flavum TaxID=1778672 RepID=A0A7X1FTX8_9SPHN|nr:DUF192 domain-containing protein [Novosphingobium flavum]
MLAVAAVALAACSPGTVESKQAGGQAVSAVHPVSGLKVVPLTAGGHKFRVEVAATGAEQEKGLMFRKEMGADEGMIFPMDPPRQAYFWMRNTVMPLDIIFIGADHKVLNVVGAKPYDETPLPSAGKAAAVLEINVGRAAQLGIGPGTAVNW